MTVFTDQARVVRMARVVVSGPPAVEFPLLRQGVDVSSIRVEADAAQVQRVDIEPVEPAALRTDEVRLLLAEFDKVTLSFCG